MQILFNIFFINCICCILLINFIYINLYQFFTNDFNLILLIKKFVRFSPKIDSFLNNKIQQED